MGWAVLIAELLKVFGPLLSEWLQKWLESLLNRAAARLPAAETFTTPAVAREAVFAEAIQMLPRFAFARRAMLRRMQANPILTPAVQAEFRDLAGAAENE